ncbi:MAG: hypothetical protein ACTIJH_06380 [Moraxellaceae bacterium]
MNISTHDEMSNMAQLAIEADVLKPVYYEGKVWAVLNSYGIKPTGKAAEDVLKVIECINDDRDFSLVATYNKDGGPWVLYRSCTVF